MFLGIRVHVYVTQSAAGVGDVIAFKLKLARIGGSIECDIHHRWEIKTNGS